MKCRASQHQVQDGLAESPECEKCSEQPKTPYITAHVRPLWEYVGVLVVLRKPESFIYIDVFYVWMKVTSLVRLQGANLEWLF